MDNGGEAEVAAITAAVASVGIGMVDFVTCLRFCDQTRPDQCTLVSPNHCRLVKLRCFTKNTEHEVNMQIKTYIVV